MRGKEILCLDVREGLPKAYKLHEISDLLLCWSSDIRNEVSNDIYKCMRAYVISAKRITLARDWFSLEHWRVPWKCAYPRKLTCKVLQLETCKGISKAQNEA